MFHKSMKCSMKSHFRIPLSPMKFKKLKIAIRHVQLIHVTWIHGQARDSRLGSGTSVLRTGISWDGPAKSCTIHYLYVVYSMIYSIIYRVSTCFNHPFGGGFLPLSLYHDIIWANYLTVLPNPGIMFFLGESSQNGRTLQVSELFWFASQHFSTYVFVDNGEIGGYNGDVMGMNNHTV